MRRAWVDSCVRSIHCKGARSTAWRIVLPPAHRYHVRLIGAVLLEQNDEWQLQHRYMQVEAMAELVAAASAADPRQIPCAV